MKKNHLILLVTGILLIATFIFGSFFYTSKKSEEVKELAKTHTDLFVRPHSPTLGPEDAPVTIVEFLDPECESCRRFYPLVKKILAEFSDDVRLVIRYTPFHKNSIQVIHILEAARKQNKFWETLELLFVKQPEWGDHHNPRPELIWTYLPALGLDTERLKADINDLTIPQVIQMDVSDGKELNVRATPTFFVNGRPLKKFGYEGLRELVQDELSRSRP